MKQNNKDQVVVFKTDSSENWRFNEELKQYEIYYVGANGNGMGLAALVRPVKDKEKGVYQIKSNVISNKDIINMYYSKEDRKELKRLEEKAYNLYQKLTEKGISWEEIREDLRYRNIQNNKKIIMKENTRKHDTKYLGVTSYKEGAENVSRRNALNLAHRLASVEGMEVIDNSNISIKEI
jgi:hypothetical protein